MTTPQRPRRPAAQPVRRTAPLTEAEKRQRRALHGGAVRRVFDGNLVVTRTGVAVRSAARATAARTRKRRTDSIDLALDLGELKRHRTRATRKLERDLARLDRSN